MVKIKTYDVEEYTIGDKEGVEQIIFASRKQMREAKQAFEDGEDIEVRIKDNNDEFLTFSVPHKLISNKLYIAEIRLAARDGKEDEV